MAHKDGLLEFQQVKPDCRSRDFERFKINSLSAIIPFNRRIFNFKATKMPNQKAKLKTSVKVLIFILIFFTAISLFFYLIKPFSYNFFPKEESKVHIKPPVEEPETEKKLGFLGFTNQVSGHEKPMKYLVLFQNSMELRPGGGYIGSFAEIEIEDGKIKSKQVYNTNVYDLQIPNKPSPPFLISDKMLSTDWGLRDSNWALDFNQNAKFFLKIYKLANPKKNFDGVIAVTTKVLPFLIEQSGGPIKLEGIEGNFTPENVIEKLEYEVEVNYTNRGIAKDQRKEIINHLMTEIINRIQ
ncbi:MAG: DUF4012 domain-containing protein, partial [Candidatus Moranbacteria bacterium]|nr:DUF4012 domain-containing protein [Candidatus Moranbacteria bacterium]